MQVIYIKINVFIKGLEDSIASYFGGGIPEIDLHGKYIILPHRERVFCECDFEKIVKKIYKQAPDAAKSQDIAGKFSGGNKYGTLIEDGGNTIHFLNHKDSGTWTGAVKDLLKYITDNCTEVKAYIREED